MALIVVGSFQREVDIFPLIEAGNRAPGRCGGSLRERFGATIAATLAETPA
jgi:hypothetical protein